MTEERRFVIRATDRGQGWPVARECAATLREACQQLQPGSNGVEVWIRPYRKRRSLAMNRCLHGWCKIISDFVDDHYGIRHPPLAWKEYFKQQFLGETQKTMPDGTVVSYTQPSRELNTEQFGELLTRIDAWAATELSLQLPRNDDWMEAMGND